MYKWRKTLPLSQNLSMANTYGVNVWPNEVFLHLWLIIYRAGPYRPRVSSHMIIMIVMSRWHFIAFLFCLNFFLIPLLLSLYGGLALSDLSPALWDTYVFAFTTVHLVREWLLWLRMRVVFVYEYKRRYLKYNLMLWQLLSFVPLSSPAWVIDWASVPDVDLIWNGLQI